MCICRGSRRPCSCPSPRPPLPPGGERHTMTGDLFWPGDERAGDLFGAEGFLAALTAVEEAWLNALVSAGIAPPEAAAQLSDLVGPADVDAIALAAEAGGNPVIPL